MFFDNNTSPVLADTLDGYLKHSGRGASHIRDLPCGRHAQDIEWIGHLSSAAQDWLVVTGDGRIQKNKAERMAFRRAGLRGFVLAPIYQKTPIHQQASFLLWRWPEIENLLNLAPPFLFEVPMARQSKIRPLPI